jgi:hypothetical protein
MTPALSLVQTQGDRSNLASQDWMRNEKRPQTGNWWPDGWRRIHGENTASDKMTEGAPPHDGLTPATALKTAGSGSPLRRN